MNTMKQTIAVMAVALVGLWTVNATAILWTHAWDGTGSPVTDGFFTSGDHSAFQKNNAIGTPGDHPGWMTLTGNPGGFLTRYFVNFGFGCSSLRVPITKFLYKSFSSGEKFPQAK